MGPGDICVMRVPWLGTVRVRVCCPAWDEGRGAYRIGWLKVQYVEEMPFSPMGSVREYVNVRTGRLRLVRY